MTSQLHRETLSHKTKSQTKPKQTTKANRKTKLTEQKHSIYFYCTSDFEGEIWMCVCHCVLLKVKGQFTEICSSFEVDLRSSGLVASSFTQWVIFPSPNKSQNDSNNIEWIVLVYTRNARTNDYKLGSFVATEMHFLRVLKTANTNIKVLKELFFFLWRFQEGIIP